MRHLFVLAAALRLALLLGGLWQDAHGRIRYTDIDYDVFSDAARALAAGGSPVRRTLSCLCRLLTHRQYDRDTYRYTPLLAVLLLPNVWLHPAWCAAVPGGLPSFASRRRARTRARSPAAPGASCSFAPPTLARDTS